MDSQPHLPGSLVFVLIILRQDSGRHFGFRRLVKVARGGRDVSTGDEVVWVVKGTGERPAE